MAKPVCLVCWSDPKPYEQTLAQAGLSEKLELHYLKSEQAITDDLAARADILLGMHPGSYLKRMPRLAWIQTITAGVDHWLGHPDLGGGVMLSCARGSHRIPMPENILGALFHLTKPYMSIAAAQKESRWVRHQSVPLAGKTLGILGLGAVGQELARKAAALEMRVIGTKRTPTPLAGIAKVYGQDGTDEVLGASDFIVLLLPSTADTENFINRDRLRKMKPTAWLLNFARGALIVDDDLIAAVKAKTIAGAVLDVFREEPLPSTHPFWTTEGIRVLPHLGGGSPDRAARVAEIFVENAQLYLAGKAPSTVVDRAKGY